MLSKLHSVYEGEKHLRDEYSSEIGILHRDDGPALIYYTYYGNINYVLWYYEGSVYDFNTWCRKTDNCPILMTMMFK